MSVMHMAKAKGFKNKYVTEEDALHGYIKCMILYKITKCKVLWYLLVMSLT